MIASYPAIAVIDGSLCRLSRTGEILATHQPLGSAVLEFLQGPLRLYVRERSFGLLPGIGNVYCVDAGFRLQWVAEWPLDDDPCERLGVEQDGTLLLESAGGAHVRLSAETGRLLRCVPPMAAAC